MANADVILNTGQTLTRVLERHMNDLGIGADVGVVTPAAFQSLASTANPFISLFLYQIVGNAEMRGNPRRHLPDGTIARQPLPLEFCYLVTSWGARGTDPVDTADDQTATQEEARMMGAILQAFYESAEINRSGLFGAGAVWAPEDGLQIVMETLPIDGHYRIWDASELGYRLSLVYRVRVASLEPRPPLPATPVTEATLETTA